MSQIYNLNNLEDNKKCYGSIEKIKENTLKRIMEGEDNKHVHTLMTYCAVHHLDEAFVKLSRLYNSLNNVKQE